MYLFHTACCKRYRPRAQTVARQISGFSRKFLISLTISELFWYLRRTQLIATRPLGVRVDTPSGLWLGEFAMPIVLASCALAIASATALNGVSSVSPQTIAAIAASSATGTNFGYVASPGRVRVVKTYYSNHEHDNSNGKLWVSDRVYVGPGASAERVNREVPGPAYYGAPADDTTRILVRVGMTSFGISPWQRIEGRALHRLEDARLIWLNNHGYGSGVRTFVNDAYVSNFTGTERAQAEALRQLPASDDVQVLAPINARDIQPRATIRIPSDMPRFRKRMDVQRSPLGDGFFIHNVRRINVANVGYCQSRCMGQPEVRTISGRGNSWNTTLVMPRNRTVARAN